MDIYPFLEKGLIPFGGESIAPKHLSSFNGGFTNLIFALSSQFAGAVATVSYLTAFNAFAVKDYGEDYLDNEDTRKIVQQELQQVIYALNTPASARSYQSCFWNLSIFDKTYWESLFGNFMLPDGTRSTWEQVNKLQKFFLHWFNKEREHALLTFPVVTVAMLNDGKDYTDKEYKEVVAKELSEGNSFFIYTSDSVDSLSSCCFLGDELIELYEDDQKITLPIKEFVTRYTTIGEVKITSNYYVDSFDVSTETVIRKPVTGVLAKRHYGKLVEITVNDKKLVCTPDHMYPVVNTSTMKIEEVEAENLSIEEHMLLSKDMKVHSITNIKYTEPTSVMVYDIEVAETEHFIANDIITHNCRLRNAIDTTDFSYSLGAGGIQTGSKNVITINMNRLIQNAYAYWEENKNLLNMELLDYIKKAVVEQVKLVHLYQTGFESYFQKLKRYKMLPAYDAGFISLENQYLTVGLSSILEGAEFLGFKASNNDEYLNFIGDLLSTITETNKEFTRKTSLKVNTEIVPSLI